MTAPALELVGLRKSFGRIAVIRGVDLRIEPGERHAIIGPNGAGKSTLFHLISGRFPPSAGAIRLKGKDIAGLPPYEIRRRGLARSFQVTNIFPRLSVFENLRCGLLWPMGYKYAFWRNVDRLADLNERSERLLEEIGLADRRRLPAGVLTYSEQRALEIGIALAGGADVLMLDEPTAGMSRSETDQTVELIRRVTVGKALVVVEHDVGVVFGLADRISVLVYGQLIATDTPDNIRRNEAVQEAYLGTARHGEEAR
ncbi:MAG TPA: ABC transporter ATP-binding protein [Stellaceae bacterium]|nr:ABC transporter ATP-binding protein [Stellaceae bacterium]